MGDAWQGRSGGRETRLAAVAVAAAAQAAGSRQLAAQQWHGRRREGARRVDEVDFARVE